jgi:hypothetical protein
VVTHVVGLGFTSKKAIEIATRTSRQRHPVLLFAMILGETTLVATALHGIVAIVWAVAYQLLGALPEARSAILYSLNRDYKLRACQSGACQSGVARPMAPHGSTGGAERVAPVRPVGPFLFTMIQRIGVRSEKVRPQVETWVSRLTFIVVFASTLLPGRVRIIPPWVVVLITIVMILPMAGLWLSPAKQRWLQIESVVIAVFVLVAGVGMIIDLKDVFVNGDAAERPDGNSAAEFQHLHVGHERAHFLGGLLAP